MRTLPCCRRADDIHSTIPFMAATRRHVPARRSSTPPCHHHCPNPASPMALNPGSRWVLLGANCYQNNTSLSSRRARVHRPINLWVFRLRMSRNHSLLTLEMRNNELDVTLSDTVVANGISILGQARKPFSLWTIQAGAMAIGRQQLGQSGELGKAVVGTWV